MNGSHRPIVILPMIDISKVPYSLVFSSIQNRECSQIDTRLIHATIGPSRWQSLLVAVMVTVIASSPSMGDV